jgi:hypothetical protein
MWLKIEAVAVIIINTCIIIGFNWHLLTRRLNSTAVHYKANTNTRTTQMHYKHAIIIIIMRFRIGMPSFKKRYARVLTFDQSLFSFLFLKTQTKLNSGTVL